MGLGFFRTLWITAGSKDFQGGFMSYPLRVVVLKPSKSREDGYVERFRWQWG
jgi:hypothetical protein